jgi:hypothetical protein
MQFPQYLLNVPNPRLIASLMSDLFLCWICMMLLYKMETTGNVSEMHFTTLVENAIDWSESHRVWPQQVPLQCARQMAREKNFM